MIYQFSNRVSAALEDYDVLSQKRKIKIIKAALWQANQEFAQRCIEFQEALGGYAIEGRYQWNFGIDINSMFNEAGISYVECVRVTVAAPFDFNLNNYGQLCADTTPMAATPIHFLEREAIANWCRKLWYQGRRLRTTDSHIEVLFDENLTRVTEASDEWETWWIDEDRQIAACKFLPWGNENTVEFSYWLFDPKNSIVDNFISILNKYAIEYSIDAWLTQ